MPIPQGRKGGADKLGQGQLTEQGSAQRPLLSLPIGSPFRKPIALQPEAVAVVLDLVEPLGAVRDDGRLGGDAELKHAPKIGIRSNFCERNFDRNRNTHGPT